MQKEVEYAIETRLKWSETAGEGLERPDDDDTQRNGLRTNDCYEYTL